MYCYSGLQKLQEEFLGSFGWTSDTYDFQIFITIISSHPRTVDPGGGGGGGPGISSDGGDRRIFWGLKFLIPGFFGVRKFGLGSLI